MNSKTTIDVLGLEDTLDDDDELLPDRLLRAAHRAKDGHISSHPKHHEVNHQDNMLVLYVYTRDDEGCVMHRHFVYGPHVVAYETWREMANSESRYLAARPGVVGVFGWNTTYVNFTPLREDDLLTKVTRETYTHVRLTFSARKNDRTPRAAKSAQSRKRNYRAGVR